MARTLAGLVLVGPKVRAVLKAASSVVEAMCALRSPAYLVVVVRSGCCAWGVGLEVVPAVVDEVVLGRLRRWRLRWRVGSSMSEDEEEEEDGEWVGLGGGFLREALLVVRFLNRGGGGAGEDIIASGVEKIERI